MSPVPVVGLSVSVFRGRDEYPDQQFGLLNNDNTGVTFGADLMPSDKVTIGFTAGRETYSALQQSRSANPLSATDTSFNNPNRNWNLNSDEVDNSYGVHLDLVKVIPKADIRFGYDYDHSDNAFAYGGQRVLDMISGIASTPGDSKPCSGAVPCFNPLPNATNKLVAASVDLKYFITPKIALGANFLHQKFDVSDFSTPGALNSNTYDPLGGLILGYGFRPYTANVGGFRVMYLF